MGFIWEFWKASFKSKQPTWSVPPYQIYPNAFSSIHPSLFFILKHNVYCE